MHKNKKDLGRCFIYLYEFKDGKKYVGQTHEFAKRYGDISSYWSNKELHDAMLLKDYKKSILEYVEEDKAAEIESFYIKKYDCVNNGYNTRTYGWFAEKGNIPWNKDKKTGISPPNKGVPSKNWLSKEKYEKVLKQAMLNIEKARLLGKSGFKKGSIPKNRKSCKLFDVNTKEMLDFDSITEAALFCRL